VSTGLELCNLVLRLKDRLIAQMSVRVAPAEVLTVMGPSGSGKSTLLAAIIGAAPAAFTLSGQVILGARDVSNLPPHARRIGILFQDDVLFPHLSVGQNLGFGLVSGQTGAARRATIEAALAAAGLAGFAARDPATLSGGQRGRVALLRALLARPEALLLDEPFSRLDAALRAQFRSFVFAETRKHGLPVILVTHDLEDARAAGGRVMDPMGQELRLPDL
jgi:putative thiamine transport system ATP-binding protein